jgi:hypothetical protein
MLKNPVAKKTKKEKLLAEKRRLLALVAQQNTSSEKAVLQGNSHQLNTFTFKQSVELKVENSHPEQPKESYGYVATDLKKIAVLTTFAICAQVVLWYLLEKQLISLF